MHEADYEWMKEHGFMMASGCSCGEVKVQDMGETACVYFTSEGKMFSHVCFLFHEDEYGCFPDHVVASSIEDAMKAARTLMLSELWKMSDLLHGADATTCFSEVSGKMWNVDHTKQCEYSHMVADFGPFKVWYSGFDSSESLFGRFYNVDCSSQTVRMQLVIRVQDGYGTAMEQLAGEVDSMIENVGDAFSFLKQ